jgi:hypothetical protein
MAAAMPSPMRKESLGGFIARTFGAKPVAKPKYAAVREEMKRKKKA